MSDARPPAWCVPVAVRASHTALFVTLTAGIDGHFSHNCFDLLGGEAAEERVIQFASDAQPDVEALRATLRVDDLSMHQLAQGPAPG
jgi:hypothetical protein